MGKMLLLLFVVTVAFQGISAQVPGFGSCPNPSVKPSFDLTKYLGIWYEVRRTFPIFFELGVNCAHANYTLNKTDNSVIVVNTGSQWGIHGRTKNEIVGRAYAPDPNVPAKLLVNFPSAGSFEGNYWVLDTDYKSYSIVYSCSSLGGFAYADIVWILGRQRTLPNDVVSELEKYIKEAGVRTWPLRAPSQKDCPF